MIKIDLKDFEDKLKQSFAITKKAIDKKMLESVLKEAVKMIKVRVSQGYGSDKGKKTRLKELKPSTVKSRERKKKKGKLASGVGPKKSRLTETGQMIDAITYKINNMVGELFFKRARRGGKITNEELASLHEYGGTKAGRPPKRPFFSITDQEKKKLTNILRREIKNKLKNIT